MGGHGEGQKLRKSDPSLYIYIKPIGIKYIIIYYNIGIKYIII